MKKLLISGSNGFVGKYFINKYKNKYEIKTFSFLKDDINSLDCSDIDVVFHLSALVHQMGGASREEYERVNVTQTLQLAKKAKTGWHIQERQQSRPFPTAVPQKYYPRCCTAIG